MKGAKENLDVIVRGDLVAVGEARPRCAVFLERTNAEMNGRCRIPHEDLGRVIRCHTIIRRELAEARQ